MRRKDSLIRQLERTTESMVQGSLSESTRRCGDPSCACARDPAYRHGPHLYLKFESDGKTRSVYVPADSAAAVRDAHAAWQRFQRVGAEISAVNRARLLRELEREKKQRKAGREKRRNGASRGQGS